MSDLNERIQKAASHPLTIDEARERYEEFTEQHKGEKFKKLAEQVIWNFLSASMTPFCCGGIGYLLPKQDLPGATTGVPIAVTKDGQDFNFLLINLGVHPGGPMRDRVGQYVGTMCCTKPKTEAHVSFHYDSATRAAYFAEQRGFLIKVTASEITRAPNGTDGQLFLFNDNYEPWTYTAPVTEYPERMWDPTEGENDDDPTSVDLCPSDALLPRLVFHVLQFENTSLIDDDLEVLLNAYVMTLFLPGITTGRLLLQVLGETGSAKTLFCRMVGRLIYGRQFNVIGLSDKEEQVENALVNSSFVVFDDVKRTSNANILGMIRRACTGGSCSRRELYSTFKQVTEPYRAAVAITCSEEPFGATDEMSNRSLIIKAAAREDFVREEKLLRQIDENRDALMNEMMVRAKAVITAISAQRHYEPTVRMRMASFATFLLQVARHWEWLPAAEKVLEAWKEEQEGATIDQDIAAILTTWMREPDWETANCVTGNPKHYGPMELLKELTRVSVRLGTTPWWLGKEKWLTRALRSAHHAYRKVYGFDFTRRTSGHKPPEYWFDPSPEQLQQIKAGLEVPF